MHAKELPEFKDQMEELASCFPGTELQNHRIELYFDVLKPFTLAVIRRACLAILGETTREQFFPKAAELKLQCLGLYHEDERQERGITATPYELRCQHRDQHPPHSADGESRQCSARFSWPPIGEQPERYYCDHHRTLYSGEGRATEQEIDRILVDWLKQDIDDPFRRDVVADRARRHAEGESITTASLHAILEGFTAKVYARAERFHAMMGAQASEDQDHPDALQRAAESRKAQFERARQQGLDIRESSSALLEREPGEDDT